MGQPEEITQLIMFLASDKASFSTGATFAADGGKTARFEFIGFKKTKFLNPLSRR